MVLVLRSAPRVGVHTCPLLLVLVTLICSHHISYVVGVLPTPSYDLQWDTVGEATGATRAIWSAGTFPHDGIVSTNDDSQGGFISPTFPSSTVTLTFPFTIRVGVIIKPTQVAINQWQRIWSFHNGVGGADVVSIQHYQNTNDLFMEFVAGGPQTSRQFTNSWDLLDDGAWHDLIFTATSTTDVKLWIDSVQQTETNVVTTNPGSAFITTAKGVYLGKSSFGDAPPNAAWDFLEIYPQAFTQTQVDEAFDEFVGTIGGDPQIAGFQGQDFQFHGIPGEMFNLITSPTFQLNSKFVYLASGSCQYNHTQCWSHPGTYLSHLGFMIPDHHVQLVAGSHQQGLSLHIDGKQVHNDMIDNTTTTHIYELGNDHISMNINHISNERVKLSVPSFDIIVINSDMFFNLMIAVTDPTLLQSGSKQHHYRQHHVTSAEYVYPAIPIHGLTGQTWRNAAYGPDHQLYEGEADDYLIESQNLFGCDFKFNQYRGCQQA